MMDVAKRGAVIKQQAAKKKEKGGKLLKGMGSSNPSTKTTLPEKQDRFPKKPKTTLEPVVGLAAEGKKMVPCQAWSGKGFYERPVCHPREATYPPP